MEAVTLVEDPKPQLNPVICHAFVDVRFSDMDAYGHVNSKNYIDFIGESRWKFYKDTFGFDAEDYVKRGIGFFTGRMEINFKRPITAKEKSLFVKSYAVGLDRAKVSVDFEILSQDKAVSFSTGRLEIYCVDLKTGKPQIIPDWLHAQIFKPS